MNLGNLSVFSLFDAAVDLRCSEYKFDIVHKTVGDQDDWENPSATRANNVQLSSREFV